jgi:mono/diheme cytochrome c family protein
MGNRALLAGLLLSTALLWCAGCASRGRELFVSEGCVSCHRFRGAGGGMGPDLTDVASRKDDAAIRRQIVDPGAGDPNSRMPAFTRLSWYELRSLSAYLRSRP